jgi:hypothetical protein
MAFSLSYSLGAENQGSDGSREASGEDIQKLVNASLGLMAGGCEVCMYAHYNNSPALFCERRKTPVNWGSPRCDFFVRSSVQSKDSLV